MKKKILKVPKGIRYISDWSDYSLSDFDFPHILNKTLTGCGFTSDCITNNLNIILCSPRRILLENKQKQFPDYLFYVKNEVEKSTDFEKDLSSANFSKPSLVRSVDYTDEEEKSYKARVMQMKDEVRSYWNSCKPSPFSPGKPCKLLVTYDSFRHVKEALGGEIENFYVVVDEFQSIFTDSKFKSDTELDFVNYLQDLQKVCLVSATPMLEKYLDMLDEFKDLPYFELDWYTEEPSRIIKPHLEVKYCGKKNTIQSNIKKIIEKYRLGNFDTYKYRDSDGNLQEIQSKEAVIYVNSVKDIAKVIKSCNLTIDECNVLVSRCPANEDIIRKAFEGKKRDGIEYIGYVPDRNEHHKMFTFCTRTVYLGADFYSTNAKSYIFSNANIDSLSVDISMDLPQILGRQRLEENPWKNSAELYVTLRTNMIDSDIFKQAIKDKIGKTRDLLSIYEKGTTSEKHNLAENYLKVAKTFNYRDDYVAVNRHSGRDLLPTFNNLVMVAEMRTFEIQEVDYADRFTLFSNLQNSCQGYSSDMVEKVLQIFENELTNFIDRMKFLCKQWEILNPKDKEIILSLLPDEYRNYLSIFTVEEISACSFKRSVLSQRFDKLCGKQDKNQELLKKVCETFELGKRYSKQIIKETLRQIYDNLGYESVPKATDLEQWFNIKETKVTNPVTKKRDKAYEILSIKE